MSQPLDNPVDGNADGPTPEEEQKTRPLGPPHGAADADAGDDTLPPGTAAGAYILVRPLASGGGGTVYEAKHRLLGRPAAVKVLRNELAGSPQMVARFLREARAVNMIRHPNIIDIYEFGELPEGRPFYVMELLAGTDLRTLLAERGRFPPAEVLEILEPVCSALEAAHAQGIVHRDLKASNIQVIEEGERRTVKLLDFGIAKLIHPDAAEAGLTVVGTRLGTSYTMAPEQIRGGTIDGRTDVYALGVVLHQLVTGHYPFRADQMTEIERLHLEAPPPRPSQLAPVPPALDAVVLRAMEKAPDRRFPGVRAFIEALADAVGARSRHAGPEGATEGTVARAVAIYVDVRMAEIPDGAGDDILDDVSLVLDLVEQQLRHRGWLMPLQTGNALLGAKVLPADAAAAIAATAEALAAAEALAGEIRGRPSAHPDVHVNVCFHVDNALVTDSSEAPGGKEIVGGDLTAIAAWAPQENVPGLHVTAAAGLG